MVRLVATLTLFMAGLGLEAPGLQAQDRRDEQFYYPGGFNWQFLRNYPEAARLFNAFDYGHAVLYEKLYTKPPDLKRELEERQYNYLTRNLLIRPPRFAVAEEVIEPSYARLAWRAKLMFDWAHVLHRQIYDLYADERLDPARRDSLIERVTDYYLSNRRLAFAAVPKAMSLMDEQDYSQAFRREFPKFNGLIWAYHWLQVGLYEPLIEGQSRVEKKAGVKATLARFWSMLQDPPSRFPRVMPMTSAIAPRFAAAHPRAAIIFDNLHMTHDIISDILLSDQVPQAKKRQAIYAALDEMQDATRNVMALEEWRDMAAHMGGVARMGGPATGLLPEPDTGGAAPAAMDHGAMRHGVPHEPKGEPGAEPQRERTEPETGGTEVPQSLMSLYRRLLADPVIRRRVAADPVLRRDLEQLLDLLPAAHRAHLGSLLPPPDSAATPAEHDHHRD
ncbi:MAG TPA: hypothetical protein VNJ71_08215 [Gemmatimonadales bacterium]|jgi:acid stress-induced BolA-like protein IbaG/YrbA|nr:hypothetical protein [Gemmatimonadales bacterium]